jgi:hypothetical protein
MVKPFGKSAHHGRTLTKGLRFTIALWVAALPAYFLCRHVQRTAPTLSDSPFFGPAFLGFTIFYAAAMALWLKRRPSPRAPGTSSRTGLFLSRFFLSLLLAAPAGLVCAFLYEPAFELANAQVSRGRSVEFAIVDQVNAEWVLDSPYWKNDFRWVIRDSAALPPDLKPGSLAKITVQKGLLGARWIQSIEYTVLR